MYLSVKFLQKIEDRNVLLVQNIYKPINGVEPMTLIFIALERSDAEKPAFLY